jgi:hypothetical protein
VCCDMNYMNRLRDLHRRGVCSFLTIVVWGSVFVLKSRFNSDFHTFLCNLIFGSKYASCTAN